MKKHIKGKVFFISILLTLSVSGISQNIIISEKDTIASIDSLGNIKDMMGQQIGEITVGGDVKNLRGEVIGHIQGDEFKDLSGRLLGTKKTMTSEVQIIMPGNIVFATLKSGNKIVGNDGQVIMSSSGSIDEKYLLAYFFYF